MLRHTCSICKTDDRSHPFQLGEVEVAGEACPRDLAPGLRRIDRVDSGKRDAAQDEGSDRTRQIETLNQATGGDGTAVACLGEHIRERVAAHNVDGTGPALGAKRFAGRRQYLAVDDLGCSDLPAVQDDLVFGLEALVDEISTVPARSIPGISGKDLIIGAVPVIARQSLKLTVE